MKIFDCFDYHPYLSVRKLDSGFDEVYRRSGKTVNVDDCTVIKVDIDGIYRVIGEYVSFALDFIDEFYEIIDRYRDSVKNLLDYSNRIIECKNTLESGLGIKL